MPKRPLLLISLVILTLLVTGCGEESVPTAISATPVPTSPGFPETAAPTLAPTPAGSTWMKHYGGGRDEDIYDIQLDENGEFLIVGNASIDFNPDLQQDIYLIRTGPDGETLLEVTLPSEDHKVARALSPTQDGGFLISGSSISEANGQDIFLLQLDSEFQEIWSTTIGGPLDEIGKAWPLADGSYLLAGDIVDPNDFVADSSAQGYAGFEGRSNLYFARVDRAGNEIWTRTFGGESNLLASEALMTQDGGFLMLAHRSTYPELDDDIYLLKIDMDGNEVWSRTWEAGNLTGKKMIQTSDGNYLIVGSYSPAGDPDPANADFLFLKVDPAGNEVWLSVVGDPESYEIGFALVETPDGGYLAAGDYIVDPQMWRADILLVKVDPGGQLAWKQVIETNTHTMIREILLHPAGGYVITGSTVHGSNFDILLIKTDENGLMQGS